MTRRRALKLIGIGATAGAALPRAALAQGPAFQKGAIIRTLLKDIAPEDLSGGATLFHEHMSLAPDFLDRFRAAAAAARAANGLPPAAAPARAGGAGAAGPPNPVPPDPMRDVALMTEELSATRRAGVACVVDAGHPDMGRDLSFVRQASMRSGMPIVAGAGFYSQPFYPKEISTMGEEQIVQALIRQADDDPAGVFGEIGSWDEITTVERKVFRAVGKAHLATNLPIITHTGIPGKAALEQLDILEDGGVKPEKVVIGHLGNLNDPNVVVHRAICRRGAFIGFDRQGGGNDAQQVPMIMTLIDAGFADHLLFSGDASRGYGRVMTNFIPRLKMAGANDAVLRRIMVDNPRRFLAFVPKKKRK